MPITTVQTLSDTVKTGAAKIAAEVQNLQAAIAALPPGASGTSGNEITSAARSLKASVTNFRNTHGVLSPTNVFALDDIQAQINSLVAALTGVGEVSPTPAPSAPPA